MKTYYTFILLLLFGLSACSQDTVMQAHLDAIDSTNAALKQIRLQSVLEYKYKDSEITDYTIIKETGNTLFFNNTTTSFALQRDKNTLYFYDSFADSLYISRNTSDYPFVLFNTALVIKHDFVFAPQHYILTGFTRSVKATQAKHNTAKDYSHLSFKMTNFNDNMLDLMSGHMFVNAKGAYTIDTNTFLIQSFVKEQDSANIVGEGIWKSTYTVLNHNLDNTTVEKLYSFVDSIIQNKSAVDFPSMYEVDIELRRASTPQASPKADVKTNSSTEYAYTLAGDSIHIPSISSDYILIDFWFMACPGCIQGIPHVNDIYQDYDKNKLTVLGINPVDKNTKAVKSFVRQMKIQYPVYVADKALATKYGVAHYPTYILIDNRQKTPTIIGNYSMGEPLKQALKEVME